LLRRCSDWLEREQRDVIEFLREENRVLKRQLRGRRLQLCDDERRRLAVLGERLGRRVLAEVTSLVTPETMPAVLRNNSRRGRFQLVVMMQAAETRADYDAMSGR
jgi:hypothetical protein